MNRDLFVELIKEHQGALRRFLAALCCGDMSRADDLAQDACVKAYLTIESFRGDRSKFSSWLMKIGYNTFIDYRRTVRNQVAEDAAAGIAADSRADSAFDHQALYQALTKLPGNERASIVLFYLQDYQVKEIAPVVGASEEAVRKQLSRGRMHLKSLLENHYGK